MAGWFPGYSRGGPELGGATDDLAAWCFAHAPRRRKKLGEERRRALGRLRARGLLDETQQRALDALPLGHSPLYEE